MAAAVKPPVNADRLAWAREEYGLTRADAAHALHVKVDKLASWEAGEALPTLNQLRNAADLYQRTPAFFLLPEVPIQGHRRPTDFRSFGGDVSALDSALAREVARAKARRANLLQLGESTGHRLPPDTSVLDDPGGAAARVRDLLGISVDQQFGFDGTGQALNAWIAAVEELGVLVFQMSRVEPSSCRGFSVYETVLPVIVLNGAEGPGARQFTLFHELAHLLSRTSAICDVWRDNGAEAQCNAFAAEVLMPRGAVRDLTQARADVDPAVLARSFSVSRSAAAVRLRTLGQFNQDQLEAYLQKAREAALSQREAERTKQKSGGPSAHLLKVRNLGPRFVGAVLDAMHDEQISVVEAAQILESKVQALDKLEAEAGRRGVAS